MATYPIKMLRDEEGKPFVPLISIDSIKEIDGEGLEEKLDKKLEATNIKAGSQIEIKTEGNNVIISNAAEGMKLIDSLNTDTPGDGALDAHQGKVLKESIPEIVNNLTTIDSQKALSAHQGYVLAGRVAPTGGATGQVLKKASDSDYSFEWGDAADPNAIVGDGSIMKIVELSYEEYLELEAANQLQDDTEYHINDWSENERTYLTDDDIQKKIEDNVINNTTSSESTKSLSAAQGKKLQAEINQLKDWQYTPSQLIGEVTATDFVSKLTLDNLNLTPGVYEIIYAEFSSKSTGMGHVMRMNGLTSGYQGIHMHPADMQAGASGVTWRIAYHGNGFAYVNGWNQGTGLCYGVYTLHYFNKDWITVTGESHIVLNPTQTGVYNGGVDGCWNIMYQQGSYNGHVTNSINSISLEPLDDSLIGTGSYIRIYKK